MCRPGLHSAIRTTGLRMPSKTMIHLLNIKSVMIINCRSLHLFISCAESMYTKFGKKYPLYGYFCRYSLERLRTVVTNATNATNARCVRLSRLLVGFRTHFKSLHFHFILFYFTHSFVHRFSLHLQAKQTFRIFA